MQRNAFILLSIFLSVLISYGGSGVNTYFYCCGNCRADSRSTAVEQECCEVHPHHHESCLLSYHDDHNCDQSVRHTHGECSVDRIEFDWQSSQGNRIELQPKVIDLNYIFFFPMEQLTDMIAYLSPVSRWERQSQKPPDLSKEDYFSLLTLLII